VATRRSVIAGHIAPRVGLGPFFLEAAVGGDAIAASFD
jgi:hypothetical protein